MVKGKCSFHGSQKAERNRKQPSVGEPLLPILLHPAQQDGAAHYQHRDKSLSLFPLCQTAEEMPSQTHSEVCFTNPEPFDNPIKLTV